MKQSAVENLDGLIQKLRLEGVERAQQEADALIAAAKQQAADIVQAAERRAAQLIGEAEERLHQEATALRQAQERAARDWLLTVRAELNGLLQRLIQNECRAALAGPALAVDGEIKSTGKVLSVEEIKTLLSA